MIDLQSSKKPIQIASEIGSHIIVHRVIRQFVPSNLILVRAAVGTATIALGSVVAVRASRESARQVDFVENLLNTTFYSKK